MALDVTSLRKAIDALERSLEASRDAGLTDNAREAIRGGVIQHFEVAYELSWKFMQRWLRENQSPADAEARTRKDLFRWAARRGLISSPEPWFDYSDARNLTSHTYNEGCAMRVSAAASAFVVDARAFLEQLEARNG